MLRLSLGIYQVKPMKAYKRFFSILLAILVIFSMSGCRDSAVVERIIYDYLRANQTDMEKATYDDVEQREQDDKLNDLTKDDRSDRQNDAEELDPVLDSTQESQTDETAGGADYEEDANETNSKAPVDPASPENGGMQSGNGLDPNAEGNQGTHGSADTSRLVVDDYGNQYGVPQSVNTVAAVGSAAVAVLMLGGVDCLAATDAALTSDPLAAEVFSGLDGVPALWSNDSSTLNDEGLQQLIEIHPDLCLETSGSAILTNDQVDMLQENGICYVVLPAPTSIANIKLIAQTVGEILGDHTPQGGLDSVSLADTYCGWVDSAVSDAAAMGGSGYVLYVDAWDTEAYYSIAQASDCYGYGAAVIHNGRMAQCMAISNFLSTVSVTNVTSVASFSRAETIYFTPIDGNYSTITVTGTRAARLTPNKLLVEGNYLGSQDFQVVIAASQAVKTGLEACALWKSYGRVTSSNGNFNDYGFLDDYGEIVRSTIAGPYSVVVNPRGIGDWAGGSVESVLEPFWASYAVTGACSESDLRNVIREFYNTFYRYSLSEDQLDAILAGET